jgi:hypothetical protein
VSSLASFLAHEPGSEGALGGVLVVGPAAQPQALRRGPAPARHRVHVVELQPGAGRAAATGLADESALAAIALPDGAPDLGREVPRVRARAPRPGARPAGGRELALLELADEGVQGAVEDRGDLSGGELVTEQRPGVLELLVGALADGELQGEALRCQRRQPRRWGGRLNWPRGEMRFAGPVRPNLPRGKLPIAGPV